MGVLGKARQGDAERHRLLRRPFRGRDADDAQPGLHPRAQDRHGERRRGAGAEAQHHAVLHFRHRRLSRLLLERGLVQEVRHHAAPGRLAMTACTISAGRGATETTMGCSSGMGSSSAANWLSTRVAGM